MRLTKNIFNDLAIWMIGFGIIIGIIFPFFARALGVSREITFSWEFIVGCIFAGIVVGAVNIILSRTVIARKLRILIIKMRMVQENLMKVKRGGDLSDCTPEKCHVHIDSTDVIGESALVFNSLVDTLSASISAERTMQNYTKMLTSRLELESLTKRALSVIMEATDSNAGSILVEREGKLIPIEISGIKYPEKLINHSIIMEVLRTEKQRITNIPGDIIIDGLLVDFRPKAIFIEPLIYNDIPIGVILLTSITEYSEENISQAGMFSQSLSLALHNAIIHKQMQKLAAIDPLTGLLNRRYGMIRLREEYSKAIRSEGSLGVMMFDIDYFKKVNDTYGHLAGDSVLVHISRLIKPLFREGDIIMRYGGEEFCAILPGASAGDTLKMAERIRKK
ncbi:MAG TPA: GGDEF domain-containing protein [Actinobacteria bacterium]|nr:GGDEF domain-containing protein [Actinomycetota bacterium]